MTFVQARSRLCHPDRVSLRYYEQPSRDLIVRRHRAVGDNRYADAIEALGNERDAASARDVLSAAAEP